MQPALDHMRRLLDAETPGALWARLVEIMTCYQFDRLAYGISRSDTQTLTPEDQDLAYFASHNGPSGLAQGTSIALEVAFHMRTPMFRWALHNRGACSWSWAETEYANNRLSPEEVLAYQQRKKLGVEAGYSISFVDASLRGRGVIGLTARAGLSQGDVDALWHHQGQEIETICEVMHLKMRTLPMPIRRRQLTPRQREALDWVAAGKTTQDIATIMGVSPAMVEKHLKLVRETLDVGTTAQAVAKAAMMNHLFNGDENPAYHPE